MNKKVLWSMIILLWVFLLGFSVIKLFFADWFVAVAENEKILQVGNLIDSNSGITFIVDTILSILVMQFYLCSCKQVWQLKIHEYGALIIYTSILNLLYIVSTPVAMIIDLVGFIAIPLLLKANWKQTIFVFVLHQIGQCLTLFIRSEPIYLASTNYATQLIILFDMYIWLVLYYLYSNLYKEESLWERLGCRFSEIRRKLSLRKNLKE